MQADADDAGMYAYENTVFAIMVHRPFSMPSRTVRESAVLDACFPRFGGNMRFRFMAHETMKTSVRIEMGLVRIPISVASEARMRRCQHCSQMLASYRTVLSRWPVWMASNQNPESNPPESPPKPESKPPESLPNPESKPPPKPESKPPNPLSSSCDDEPKA